ncbi:MAG: carboxypeptidase-like regulatory domain-containing protein, partial [Runella zeae]
MKKLFTSICLIFIAVSVFAQTATIKGKIYSKENGGVSHANVKLRQSNIVAVADENGYFVIKNVPFGQRELVVTSVEIEPQNVKVNVNKPQTSLSV